MQRSNLFYRRVRAFTLQESIVVLCITTLVVALSFSVLQLVHSQMYAIERNLSRNTEMNQLRQALWADFYSSQRVLFNQEGDVLVCKNPLREVRYTFFETTIIREKDTFGVKPYTMRATFDGKPPTDGLVDALLLEFFEGASAERIFVFKPNSPEIHMNR